MCDFSCRGGKFNRSGLSLHLGNVVQINDQGDAIGETVDGRRGAEKRRWGGERRRSWDGREVGVPPQEAAPGALGGDDNAEK